MISLVLLIFMDATMTPDSLRAELDREVRMSTIAALDQWYVQQEDYSSALALLRTYENAVGWNDQATIHMLIGDDLLYAGSLTAAREEYLTVVSRYTKSGAANDALERLYLLENARSDTSTLKRLAHALSRIYARDWRAAEDTLKLLLDTHLGEQAYYYLALLYRDTGDIPLALGTLDELAREFPDSNDLSVPLLRAELYLLSEQANQARTVLEDIIIQHPRSIHAVQARALLTAMDQLNP